MGIVSKSFLNLDKDIADSLKRIVPGYEEPLGHNSDSTDTDDSVMGEVGDDNENKKVIKRKCLTSVETEDQQCNGGVTELSRSARRKKQRGERKMKEKVDQKLTGAWYVGSDTPSTEKTPGDPSSTNID